VGEESREKKMKHTQTISKRAVTRKGNTPPEEIGSTKRVLKVVVGKTKRVGLGGGKGKSSKGVSSGEKKQAQKRGAKTTGHLKKHRGIRRVIPAPKEGAAKRTRRPEGRQGGKGLGKIQREEESGNSEKGVLLRAKKTNKRTGRAGARSRKK